MASGDRNNMPEQTGMSDYDADSDTEAVVFQGRNPEQTKARYLLSFECC